jgi:hypothetical protein
MTALRLARRRLHSRTRAILQTAAAALTAWYVCVLALPDPRPIFACIAAVVAIGASHGQHRQRATQLVAGVVLGLAVADVLMHFIGAGAPQLAVLIVIAMSLAVLLNGTELVISEAAVSAMLLVMVGPSAGAFSPNRILEAAIGAAVALTQAREIDALIDTLDDALETGRETVRTAPSRFGAREPVERYDRSFEQIDLAVRNTRVLARHVHRTLRLGSAPAGVATAVGDLARSVWVLAAAYEEPARAHEARELARCAAAGAAGDALGESVRSTAVDLMRAADLVAGDTGELPSEELLLGLARHDQRLRAAAVAAEERDACPFVATIAQPSSSSTSARTRRAISSRVERTSSTGRPLGSSSSQST